MARPTPIIRSLCRGGALALLATLMLAAAAASSASAATMPPPQPVAFALSPVTSGGTLRLRGAPGQVLRGEVLVRNTSGRPITVILQAADIQNASNGNASFVTTHLSQTGRWLRLATRTVRLAPDASHRIAFTISIPAGSRGASHYAGIVATNAAQLAAATVHRTNRRPSFTFYRIDRQALPITIRLPGPLSRRLMFRSARIVVAPIGAGLLLGLLPGGTELIEGARVRLRVERHGHTLFTYVSTLGQLFPHSLLDYRIPWKGRPTQGSYQLKGVIRPREAAAVYINQTIEFSAAKGTVLKHEATPTPGASTPGTPGWVWPALALAAVLLMALSVAVWKLARRPVQAVA
jgi:hypothetical protein